MTGPTDDVIIKNTANLIEQLLRDIKAFGLHGRTRHDGPVLYTSPHTTNGDHLTRVMSHFIDVWERLRNNPPTPIDKDRD